MANHWWYHKPAEKEPVVVSPAPTPAPKEAVIRAEQVRCFLVEPTDHDTWRRTDTGEEQPHRHDFGPGAMWFATWQQNGITWDNETEPHLIVICPGGTHWDLDSRASNCGSPENRTHRCWVRHGEAPNITVDKTGETCNAGAGSILAGKYHGYLRNGVFT